MVTRSADVVAGLAAGSEETDAGVELCEDVIALVEAVGGVVSGASGLGASRPVAAFGLTAGAGAPRTTGEATVLGPVGGSSGLGNAAASAVGVVASSARQTPPSSA